MKNRHKKNRSGSNHGNRKRNSQNGDILPSSGSSVIELNHAKRVLANIDDIKTETIHDYAKVLPHFVRYGNKIGWGDHTYSEYKKTLRASDLAPNTQRKRLFVAKVFLTECHNRGYIKGDRNPTAGVKNIPSADRHLRQPMTKKETRKLCTYIRSLSHTKVPHTRARAMVSLLVFHGLRLCELQRLSVNDLTGHRILMIRQKGDEYPQPLRLNKKCHDAIVEHIKVSKLRGNSALFPSQSNRTGDRDKRMSIDGLRRVLTKIYIAAGVSNKTDGERRAEKRGEVKFSKPRNAPTNPNKRCTPHAQRHTFVTALAGVLQGDLLAIQRVSRHKSISSVIRYCREYETDRAVQRAETAFTEYRV